MIRCFSIPLSCWCWCCYVNFKVWKSLRTAASGINFNFQVLEKKTRKCLEGASGESIFFVHAGLPHIKIKLLHLESDGVNGKKSNSRAFHLVNNNWHYVTGMHDLSGNFYYDNFFRKLMHLCTYSDWTRDSPLRQWWVSNANHWLHMYRYDVPTMTSFLCFSYPSMSQFQTVKV